MVQASWALQNRNQEESEWQVRLVEKGLPRCPYVQVAILLPQAPLLQFCRQTRAHTVHQIGQLIDPLIKFSHVRQTTNHSRCGEHAIVGKGVMEMESDQFLVFLFFFFFQRILQDVCCEVTSLTCFLQVCTLYLAIKKIPCTKEILLNLFEEISTSNLNGDQNSDGLL